MGQHPSMGHRELPTRQRRGGGGQRTPEQGPGGPDTAGRGPGTQPQPGPQPGRGRANPLALVSPGSPRPSTAASRWSQRPSSRSTNRRNPRTCPANAASDRPFNSCAANPSTAAATTPSSSSRPAAPRINRPVECVFESMAPTYQAPIPKQPPTPKLGTTFLAAVAAGPKLADPSTALLADGPQPATHKRPRAGPPRPTVPAPRARETPSGVGPATASCGGRRRSSAGSRGRLGCS